MPEVPALIGIISKRGADQVCKLVHNGQGQMPSFARLSELEIDRLLTFLRDPAAAESKSPTPLPSAARC